MDALVKPIIIEVFTDRMGTGVSSMLIGGALDEKSARGENVLATVSLDPQAHEIG